MEFEKWNLYKMSKMNLFKNLELVLICNSKKEKGDRRCWADPPPFRPSWAARPAPPPLSPARAAPASLHPAPATWRPYAGVGRAAAGHLHHPGRDAAPRPQTTPSILSPASPSLLFLPAHAPQQQLRPHHCRRKLRRSPPVAPEPQPRRQEHQRTRRRGGKPLRTLYRGEKQPCAMNRSPELPQARRSTPPRRILRYPA